MGQAQSLKGSILHSQFTVILRRQTSCSFLLHALTSLNSSDSFLLCSETVAISLSSNEYAKIHAAASHCLYSNSQDLAKDTSARSSVYIRTQLWVP